jgi:hypothetical protein
MRHKVWFLLGLLVGRADAHVVEASAVGAAPGACEGAGLRSMTGGVAECKQAAQQQGRPICATASTTDNGLSQGCIHGGVGSSVFPFTGCVSFNTPGVNQYTGSSQSTAAQICLRSFFDPLASCNHAAEGTLGFQLRSVGSSKCLGSGTSDGSERYHRGPVETMDTGEGTCGADGATLTVTKNAITSDALYIVSSLASGYAWLPGAADIANADTDVAATSKVFYVLVGAAQTFAEELQWSFSTVSGSSTKFYISSHLPNTETAQELYTCIDTMNGVGGNDLKNQMCNPARAEQQFELLCQYASPSLPPPSAPPSMPLPLAPPSLPPSAPCEQSFYESQNISISGENEQKVEGVTPQQCAAACCNAQNLYGFVCKSFDYRHSEAYCWLRRVAAGDPGVTMVQSTNFNYWGRVQEHVNWVGNGGTTLQPCGTGVQFLIRPRSDLSLCLRVAPPFSSEPPATLLTPEGSLMTFSSTCNDTFSHHRFQAASVDGGANSVQGRNTTLFSTQSATTLACMGETATTAAGITTIGTATRMRSCANIDLGSLLVTPRDLYEWYILAAHDGNGFYFGSREHRNQDPGVDSCLKAETGAAPSDGDKLVYGGTGACTTAKYDERLQFVTECIPSPPPPLAPPPAAPSPYVSLDDITVERCEQRGYMSITDRTECTEQVHLLHDPTAVEEDLAASNFAWPRGCFWHKENFKAWLHVGSPLDDLGGTGNVNAILVCKRPEPVAIETYCGVCKTHIYLSDYASNRKAMRHSPDGVAGGTTGRPFLLNRASDAFSSASPMQATHVTRAVSTLQNDVYQLAFARAGTDPTAAHYALYESFMSEVFPGHVHVTQTPGSDVNADWYVYSTTATAATDLFIASRGTGKCVRPDMATTTESVLNTESGGDKPIIDTATCDYSAGDNPQRWNLKCEVCSHAHTTHLIPPLTHHVSRFATVSTTVLPARAPTGTRNAACRATVCSGGVFPRRPRRPRPGKMLRPRRCKWRQSGRV